MAGFHLDLTTTIQAKARKGKPEGKSRLQNRPNVITFRNLLHLGHNVITFRPLHLGSIFTFKLSTPVEVSLTNSSHVTINCKIGTLKVMIKHFSWHFAFLTRCKLS